MGYDFGLFEESVVSLSVPERILIQLVPLLHAGIEPAMVHGHAEDVEHELRDCPAVARRGGSDFGLHGMSLLPSITWKRDDSFQVWVAMSPGLQEGPTKAAGTSRNSVRVRVLISLTRIP